MQTNPAINVKPLVTSRAGRRQEENPFEIRWGINAVHRDVQLNAREVSVAILPFGEFFAVATFDTVKEFHTTDETQPKEHEIAVPALEAQKALERDLSGKNVNVEVADRGVRFGFKGEMDGGKMAVISRALLPTVSEMISFCAQNQLECPVGNSCRGTDQYDRSRRETCPTCWHKWLESPASVEYCEHIADTGLAVVEYDTETGQTERRTIRPTMEELQIASEIVYESISTGLLYLGGVWNGIAIEIGDGTRKKIQPHQDEIRKDLHETKPQDKQFELVRAFADQAASNNHSTHQAMTAPVSSGLTKDDMTNIASMIVTGINAALNPAKPQEPEIAANGAAPRAKGKNPNTGE